MGKRGRGRGGGGGGGEWAHHRRLSRLPPPLPPHTHTLAGHREGSAHRAEEDQGHREAADRPQCAVVLYLGKEDPGKGEVGAEESRGRGEE